MLTVAPRIGANNVHYRTVRQSIVIFLLALIGCAGHHEASTPSPVQDEADVLAVVVNEYASKPAPGLVLFPTSSRYTGQIPEDSLSPVEREATADLLRRNDSTWWSGVPLKVKTNYRWVTAKNVTTVQGVGAGWNGMSLSHVGFSVDRRDAVVDVGYFCGELCGGGGVVFLRRGTDNVWHIRRRYRTFYV